MFDKPTLWQKENRPDTSSERLQNNCLLIEVFLEWPEHDATLDEVNIGEAVLFKDELCFIATGAKDAEHDDFFVTWQFIHACTQFFDWDVGGRPVHSGERGR